MDLKENRRFFINLFRSSDFPGHGVHVDIPGKLDVNVLAQGNIEDRAQMYKRAFEFDLECAELIGDDRVPMLHIWSGTEVFAAAYGSPVYRPENDMPFALPAVLDAESTDRLEEPDINTGPLGEIFELADRLVDLCGSGHPVRICDIQSPFDIAALIWKKEALLTALIENPSAVHRLLQKVTDTLTRFVKAFRERYDEVCLVHCPNLWMPLEFGICLSEDDAGSISTKHFERFCFPYLQKLSDEFGGISLHSCAQSQHQWDNFLKLHCLRYVNLYHPPTSLDVAIDKFSGKAVLVPGGDNGHRSYIDFVKECLALAKQDTRFYFITQADGIDEARHIKNEIKQLCGRDIK